MADSKTFNAEEYLAQQKAEVAARKKKKQRPTEFTVNVSALPVLPTQGRAKKNRFCF